MRGGGFEPPQALSTRDRLCVSTYAALASSGHLKSRPFDHSGIPAYMVGVEIIFKAMHIAPEHLHEKSYNAEYIKMRFHLVYGEFW